MFRPFALYIGLRYLRTETKNHFISFITGLSVLGIALGVTVLVTALSIMNGFDEVIKKRVFDSSQHLTIQDLRPDSQTKKWSTLRNDLLRKPHVLGVAPFLALQGLLVNKANSQPAAVYGIIPFIESSVSSLQDKIISGQYSLNPGQQGIVLGAQLADRLALSVGNKIMLYLPVFNKSSLGLIPHSKELVVTGIFKTGKGFGLDNMIAYLHLHDLQALCQSKGALTGLRLKVDDLYKAPQLTDELSNTLPDYYIASDWTAQYGPLMTAISLQKTITLWILLLLVAIAAFNLVSSLVMIVTEKRAEIAILRTLGTATTSILSIFIIQGTIIGVIGTLIGLAGGFILSSHITALANLCTQWFHLEWFTGNVFIHELPAHIELFDFIQVGLASLLLSMIATIYPAWRATRTTPIETLRYE